MSVVNIRRVTVLDNPAQFTNPFQFKIEFECLQELPEDLEWKVIYVADAEDASNDQVLEEIAVGPVPVGINEFVLQAPAPDHSRIRNSDLIGVTVVLVTCSFMDREFLRIGYYVNNEYAIPFDPETSYPNPVDVTQLYRNVLADEPRVTRFPIDWGGGTSDMPQPVGEPSEMEEVNEDDMDDQIDEEDDEEDEEDDDKDDGEINLEDEDDDGEEGEEGDGEGDEEGDEDEGMEVILQEESMDVLQMQQSENSRSIPQPF